MISTGGNPRVNTEAEIVFNTAYRWDSYRGPTQTANGELLLDFRRIALHEFGHVVGLDHPSADDSGSTAAIMDPDDFDLEALSEDDIAGAVFLYGAGEAPSFVEEPALNVVPSLNTDLYFSCLVRGTPPFRYEVYRDGQLVGSDMSFAGLPRNSALFYIRFQQPSDFGTYRIDLINRVGRVSSRDYVLRPDPLTAAPILETDLSDLTLARGEPGSLAVFASGMPAPTFQWFKNGQPLPSFTGSTLPLQGIASEAGTYQAWATNSHATQKSRSATVTILPEKHASSQWTMVQPATPVLVSTDITFGHGQFVAVGDAGTVLTSPDGQHWKQRNAGTTAAFNSILFADGKFVASGQYDAERGTSSVFISRDAISWTRAPIEGVGAAIISRMAHGNNRFVAVTLYGQVITSPDAFTWTVSPWQAPADDYLDAICYGNGVFVVSGRQDRIWRSTDGISWTEHPSSVSTGMSSIAFGNGVFVGAGRTRNTLTDKCIVGTSVDGITWTSRTVQSVRGGPRVAYLNGRFHLHGDSSHLISSDGQQWEQRNFTTNNAGILAFGNDRYVALNPFGQSFTSRNGLSWTASGAQGGFSLRTVNFVNNRFLTFDDTRFSEDGIAWTPMPVVALEMNAATHGGGVSIAVGRSIGRSVDGAGWTKVSPSPQILFSSVAYGTGKFVAVGYRSWEQTGGIAYSNDGSTWFEPSVETPELRSVVHGPSGFIAVGKNGTLLHSTDGIAWQLRDSQTTKELHGVIWSGSRYIAVGGDHYGTIRVVSPGTPVEPNATICTSADGINWTATTLNRGNILCSIAVLDSLVVTGGTQGVTLFSNDHGLTWQEGPKAPSEIWRLAAGHGYFFATSNAIPSNLLRITPAGFIQKTPPKLSPVVTRQGSDTVVDVQTDGEFSPAISWYRNHELISESVGSSWTIPDSSVQPGVYFAEDSSQPHRVPFVLAPTTNEAFAGDAILVQADIPHPNGNIFDQYLLTGSIAQVRARPDRVSRISFRDLNEDIVQVEFSGRGVLTIAMPNVSAPSAAPNYNQNVPYVKGHAEIYVSDADETTNVSVFSVGAITAIDQSLFKSDVAYDGVADIGLLAIHSSNGQFGGVRLGNASIWNQTGVTGFWAPDTIFLGPIIIGDISSFDESSAGLVMRGATALTIAGGSLKQMNDQPVVVDGTPPLHFSPGTDSHGRELLAQTNRATFTKEGKDVTDLLVP